MLIGKGEKERKLYKIEVHPRVNLLYPGRKVFLFRLKGVGKLRLTDGG